MNMNDLDKMTAILPDYTFHIYSSEHMNRLVHTSSTGHRYLYIYHTKDHFDVITSITAFRDTPYICHDVGGVGPVGILYIKLIEPNIYEEPIFAYFVTNESPSIQSLLPLLIAASFNHSNPILHTS